MILLGLRAVAAFPKNGILKIYYVPGHTTLSLKGKIQYPHYPHIPQQSYTAKPSGTAAQFHSTFRSGNPDNPTSIASHITVSSYTAALSQCHFRSIIQSIPHTLQHQEISTFRCVTHDGEVDLGNATTDEVTQVAWMNREQIKELFDANMFVDTLEYFFTEVGK